MTVRVSPASRRIAAATTLLAPTQTPAAGVALEALRSAGRHPIVHAFPQGAIIAFDRDLRYLCAGGLALADVGLSQEMLEGKTIYEVYAQDFVDVIEPQYRRTLSGLETSMDVTFAGRTYLQRLGPVYDADGVVVAGMGFTQEVTQARRSEATLRESEQRIRLAFEHAPIGNALIGLDGRYLQVNQAMCDFMGFTAAQMLEHNVADLTHPDDLGAHRRATAQMFSGELATSTSDKRYRGANGAYVWARKSTSLIRSDDGSPLNFITQVLDITERRRNDQVLSDERRRQREAESLGHLGSWEIDVASRSVVWSDGMFEVFGVDPRQFDGDFAAVVRCIHPDDRASVQAAFEGCARSGEPFSIRHRVIRGTDGQLRWIDVRGTALVTDGGPGRVAGASTDVTEHVLAVAEAIDGQAFQQAIISASPDIIFVYDVAARSTVWTNRSVTGLLGYPATGPGEHCGPIEVLRLDDLVPDADRAAFDASLAAAANAADGEVISFDHRLRHADGSTRWFSRRTTALRRDDGGAVVQLVGVARDITDAVETEHRLQHSAMHDHLTGLPNRALLLDRLDGALVRSARDGREIGVLYCDLDGFKRVNDTAGHAAGDAVLVETARRLQGALREGDTVARVGGDEFVLVVEPWNRTMVTEPPAEAGIDTGTDEGSGPGTDRDRMDRIADRVGHSLRQPITVNGIEHVVSASIGVTYAAVGANQVRTITADQVLQDADAAMYQAKSRGKDRFEVFEHAMRADLVERGRVEQTLRRALRDALTASAAVPCASTAPPAGPPVPATGRPVLDAAYQPIFASATGALAGFEALARLTDEDGLNIPPDVFIPIAEDTGLIRPLGTHMLELACGQLAAWRATTDGLAEVTMAVNVSALQAQGVALGDDVGRVLGRHALAPCDLVLELTETALLQAAPSTIDALQVLHDLGVGIAIDDFGTGYASLRYLATLPVSTLKIDKSFTAGLPDDKTSTKIVFAVAGLAADLDLGCVVEGVETEAQRAALPGGVHLQGWLTGRPQRPHLVDLPDLLSRRTPVPT